MNKHFLSRALSVIIGLSIAIIPLTAGAQYYYNASYYPYSGSNYNYGYNYNYAPSYNYDYAYNRGYSYPAYSAYSYSYPSSNYNYNYNYSNSYYPYSYSNYGYNYNYGYSRSSSEELEEVRDLDGNVIGDFDRSGTSYNPYYRGYSSYSRTSTYYNNRGTYTIEIDDDRYVPMSVTVKRGTTIRWINKDSRSHTITGDRNSYDIDSNTLRYNDTYSKTFNSTGTYLYHDRYNNSLKGKIVVIN